MDWPRVKAALIRFFWAIVFPTIGLAVVYFTSEQTLANFGITDAATVSLISGLGYGLKKLFWPDTTF